MAHLRLDNNGELVSFQRDTGNAQLSIDDNGELIENKSRKSIVSSKKVKKSYKNPLEDGYQLGDFSKMFWNEAKEGANNLKNNIISLPGNVANTTKNILKESEALQDGYQFGDGLKTIGSTLLSGTQNFGEGVIRGGEQLVDAGADLFGGISDRINTKLEKAIGLHKGKTESEINKEKANSRKEMIATNYTDELMNAVGKDDEYKNLIESNSLIKSDNMGGAIAQELGRQSLNLLINNKVGSKSKVVQSIPMLAGSYGSGMEEAYQSGASTNEARRYGILNAATETATEWVTGGIPGLKGSAGKGLDGLASKIIGEPIEETSKSLSKALLKSGYKLIGEGTEEALSEYINPYIKQFTYEYNNDKDVLGNFKEAHSKVSPQDMITSFIMGAITAGIIDAPNNLSDIKNGYVNGKIAKLNAKQNNINNSTENNANLNNLQSSNINSQENINSSQNGLNSANNNLLNSDINTLSKPAYQYTPSDNQKINNLRESASKYFDNSANTQNLVNTFEKIIKDKNYNVVFDNTISNENGNQVNAQIKTLANGETEIRINPNSDRAGEFLIMHEVTHAIETNSMKELVLDYASKNQEFNQALESLKKTYGTEDVSSEVLSDISGQLFGNQEFINNLSMEKPNIFKRIYNSIVSLANKITGNSKESLFIKDLKNKWEEAYRNTNVEQAANNLKNDVKSSKGKLISGEDIIVSDDINGSHPSKQIAEKNLKSMLGIKYLNSNSNTEISIENKDIKKYLNDGYNNQKNMKLKKRISGNYGEILEIAQIDPDKSQPNYKGTNRGKQGFDYYDVNLAYPIKDNNGKIINYKYYESRLVVRKDNDNNFAYDLDNFKEKKGAVLDKTSLSIMADKSADGSFLNDNVPQSNKNVKSNSSSSTKYSMQENTNNMQELDNSSFYFADANRYDDLIKTNHIEYFRKDNGDVKVYLMDSNNNLLNEVILWSNTNAIKELGENLGKKIYETATDTNQTIRIGNDINNLGTDTDYFMNHRPSEGYGNASNFEENMPDIFEHPEWYLNLDEKYNKESLNALKKVRNNPEAELTIYRATIGNKINSGDWVTPSKSYAEYHNNSQFDGKGNILEMKVKAKDIQFAGDDINEFGYFPNNGAKYSQQNDKWKEHLEKNYKAKGTRTNMKDYRLLPTPNNGSEIQKANNNQKKETIKEINQKKIDNNTNAINRLNQEKDAMINRIENKIKAKKELLKSKTNLDTKLATQLNIQISNLNNQLQNRKLDYDKRIEYYQNKNNKMNSEEFKIQEQRMTKKQEYIDQAYEMTENMIDWKDKDRGIKYKINTMKRNLYDIMPKLEADKIYNTYFQPITENNAKAEKWINSYNESIKKLNLNDKESMAVQMLGELEFYGNKLETQVYQYNVLTNKKEWVRTKVSSYFNDFIRNNNIDYNKIKNAVLVFRKNYDNLFTEMNTVLKEQGYPEIEYRKGYFPHFIEEKAETKFQKLKEKLGIKSHSDESLPTDIAGFTDRFKPGKTWFGNSLHRTGQISEMNALKGFDNYIRGAADLIFHTEDIQKLRALENVIRTQYTDESILKELEKINSNQDLSKEQKQKLIDEELAKINNPLPNFVSELRSYTDNLANKKELGDRGMEQLFGRETYTIMKDVQSRVSANMVGFNISSALTNFIPITQAWGEVSTKNMFKAIRESIANQFHDDGFADCSTYLINRTKAADRLYKTKLENINSKAGVIFEGIDSITSNVIVRGKYYDNIDKGMTQERAMKNANEFAKDIMAGRSKGDMPTIFNRKSPLIKLFTAFQLEVNNQYGYMLKDLPRNLSDEAKNKLVGAFVKMFIGAWLYNKFSEAVVGRKSAFSPIDIISDSVQTAQGDSSIYDKLSSISNNIVSELPFVGGIMGGGRLPIQAAIPDIGTTVESVTQLSDSSKRTKAIKNLATELSKPIFYVAMPFGGGQIKKTIEGASMYSHDIPGSYTSTGKLRFTVKKDPLSVAQSLLFGQYSSKEARKYFNAGYAPLTENQTKEFKELNISMDTYRKYRSDLTELNKIKSDKVNGKAISGSSSAKKAYQIMNTDEYSENEKNYLLKNISTSSNKVTTKELSNLVNNQDIYKHYFSLSSDNRKEYQSAIKKYNFSSYQLYDYYQAKKKYEEKYSSSNSKNMMIDYLISSNLSDEQKKYFYIKDYSNEENMDVLNTFNINIDNYLNSIKFSNELKDNYSGNSYSDYRKKQTFKYIQSLNAGVLEKVILYRLSGYSISSYKSSIYNYINNLDISQSNKSKLWDQLF